MLLSNQWYQFLCPDLLGRKSHSTNQFGRILCGRQPYTSYVRELRRMALLILDDGADPATWILVNVRPVVHGPVGTSTGGMVYRLKFPTLRVLV